MTALRKISSLAASAAVLAGPAQAADAPGKLIPDIIVTAERRPDPAQRLPIALTAYTADSLSLRNLATPLAVVTTVPNMFASAAVGIGAANSYTLRGLGQTATDPSFSPSVGTFIDEIYIAPGAGTNFLFFDIARADVLRGPQGTLYGRNTSAGAVTIALDRPSDTLAGYGEFTYGAFHRKTARGSIDLPLSPVVQLKISGYYQNDDGYVRNTTTGERLNDSDMAGIRGAVQLKLTDTLRWNFAATYMRNDADNLPNAQCDSNAPANCTGRYAATARRAVQPFIAANPLIPLGSRLDTQMYTSHIDWLGENFALAAITGVVNSRARSAIDRSDGRAFPTATVPYPVPTLTPAGADPVTSIGRGTQFSQELKLTGSVLSGHIDYIAGLLYFDANDTADRGTAVVQNGTIDKAGYVQADFNASDRIKLTAGVRYTDEETRFAIADTSLQCTLAPVTCLNTANLVAGALPTTRKTKFWSPRFAASVRAADDVLVYASASRGFRSGGYDARGGQLATILPFAAE
ncbi:MAG: TonB-dependent receptor, partial [Sandarakinorhabdus sp.]|nr:TonB-dependent receptor [Sandarakinorhabdus sp.]